MYASLISASCAQRAEELLHRCDSERSWILILLLLCFYFKVESTNQIVNQLKISSEGCVIHKSQEQASTIVELLISYEVPKHVSGGSWWLLSPKLSGWGIRRWCRMSLSGNELLSKLDNSQSIL